MAEAQRKAQIGALVQRAASTDEAGKNEAELDIPAEIGRKAARLTAIASAKARFEERQRQSDAARGRTADDERNPMDKNAKPKGSKPYRRDFGVPAPKAGTASPTPNHAS